MLTKCRLLTPILVLVFLSSTVAWPQTPKEASRAPKPIELADIARWKRIQSPTVSDDGQWFAHRLSPNEGDSEVVIRRTDSGKEIKFPIGEVPGAGGPPPGASQPASSTPIAFSEDSKWLAFTIYPAAREAKKLRKERKPLYNKVALIELATEKKTEFEKVRRFSFSGEQAKWIALHRYAGEAQEKEKEKWSGSDLILHELSSGSQLNVGNVSEFAFDKKGQWLACIVDAQDKSGNGVQLRNISTGAIMPLDSDKAVYKGLTWTEKGDAFAVVKGVEDKAYEDKLYSVVGFTDLTAAAPRKVAYVPRDDRGFPEGMTVSPNRQPAWNDDLSGILFGIHEVKKKKDIKARPGDKPSEDKPSGEEPAGREGSQRPDDADKEIPDLVVWHWKDKRLQSQQQVEESRDKNFSYLCIYRPDEKKFIRLADDSIRQVTAAPKQKYAIGFDDREHQLSGNLDGRRYQDVYSIDLKTGSRTLAVKRSRWYFGPSPDGTQFLYYDDGHFYAYDMRSGRAENITQRAPVSFVNTEDDHNVVKPPTRVIGWTSEGRSVLISDNWDIWSVPVRGGQAANLTVNGKKDQLRYRTRHRLDPDEKGIDLSVPVYLGIYGEWTKKSGISRLDGGKPGAKVLLWDDAAFGSLIKAKSADKYLYTRETYKDYSEFYAADASLGNGQQLTNANPQQKDYLWSSGVKLIDYTSAKGDKLQAALHLPANYEPGKSYPTIVYIYEKLSQGLNSYTPPGANGFNKSVYTSNGYAVLMPDIVYKINDPGMSAVWCVLPALNAAIATGIVDKARVGLQGHSWGGYQTSFLVTQTDVFKAAVAGAPLTNMISMYSSIYWNTGGGNMAIFESSQGRFTGGYWENIEAYTRNSPVYHAKNVKTPLIILHNDKDGAVDWNQGIEYFSTLRRLQKPVVMLQYKGENHGLRVTANQKDYTVRMKEFFDHYLMGKAAPGWLVEGIPHLKLKEHLEERVPEKAKAVNP